MLSFYLAPAEGSSMTINDSRNAWLEIPPLETSFLGRKNLPRET